MDFLRPELINVDGRQYRKLHTSSNSSNQKKDEDERRPYIEEDDFYYDEPETCQVETHDLERTASGEYQLRMEDIPSHYYRFIIGRQGEKKRSIEKQTDTSIKLPSRGSEGDIVMTGSNKSGVLAARANINSIIDVNRKDQPARHFLSINLVSQSVTEKFNEFKRQALKFKSRGVDVSIFQFPERMHLTLCIFQFLNDQEIKDNLSAIEDVIKSAYNAHFSPGDKLEVYLRGIEYMNDDPAEVDVLYAQVHDPWNKMQGFVDDVVSNLAQFQFVRRINEHVKLHATIMNTIFRENKDGRDNMTSSGKPKQRERVTFDARAILDEFGDFDFSHTTIDSVDINVRGKFEKHGIYEKKAQIKIA